MLSNQPMPDEQPVTSTTAIAGRAGKAQLAPLAFYGTELVLFGRKAAARQGCAIAVRATNDGDLFHSWCKMFDRTTISRSQRFDEQVFTRTDSAHHPCTLQQTFSWGMCNDFSFFESIDPFLQPI